jgi:hypothetical protein
MIGDHTMLRVEVEMFSGRPNTEWIVTDPKRVKRILTAVAEAPRGTSKPGVGFLGLGFREVRVSLLADDPLPDGGRVGREFALASAAAKDRRASGELARMVIETMLDSQKVRLVPHEITPLTPKLYSMILDRLKQHLAHLPPVTKLKWPPYNPLRTTIHDEACDDCQYEVSKFNPSFWNTPAVQPHNNCYNYARNWRTNTFAQPGRAHGAMTSTMACPNVTTAALADGLVQRCKCLPIGEWPRRLMALVIDPGYDYHWYRHQRGGFWGHKPGGTAARNTDNSNVIITNPETCNRGGYTSFCGYFYAGRSVVIN